MRVVPYQFGAAAGLPPLPSAPVTSVSVRTTTIPLVQRLSRSVALPAVIPEAPRLL
jgi:hypothetical protein